MRKSKVQEITVRVSPDDIREIEHILTVEYKALNNVSVVCNSRLVPIDEEHEAEFKLHQMQFKKLITVVKGLGFAWCVKSGSYAIDICAE